MTDHADGRRRIPAPIELPDTLDACVKLMDELSSSSISLENVLSDAKSKALLGNYADPNWFRRATTKLKYVKRHRQMLQDHMAKIRKREKTVAAVQAPKGYAPLKLANVAKQDAARIYDRILLEVIKENTGREEFQQWVALAQQRLIENVTFIE